MLWRSACEPTTRPSVFNVQRSRHQIGGRGRRKTSRRLRPSTPRNAGPPRNGSYVIYWTAAARYCAHGSPAGAQRRNRGASAQDRAAAHHSHPSRSPGSTRRYAIRTPPVFYNSPRQAVRECCQLRQLVRRLLPSGWLAEGHGSPRVSQGSMPAPCGSRMHRIRDHGCQRA